MHGWACAWSVSYVCARQDMKKSCGSSGVVQIQRKHNGDKEYTFNYHLLISVVVCGINHAVSCLDGSDHGILDSTFRSLEYSLPRKFNIKTDNADNNDNDTSADHNCCKSTEHHLPRSQTNQWHFQPTFQGRGWGKLDSLFRRHDDSAETNTFSAVDVAISVLSWNVNELKARILDWMRPWARSILFDVVALESFGEIVGCTSSHYSYCVALIHTKPFDTVNFTDVSIIQCNSSMWKFTHKIFFFYFFGRHVASDWCGGT